MFDEGLKFRLLSHCDELEEKGDNEAAEAIRFMLKRHATHRSWPESRIEEIVHSIGKHEIFTDLPRSEFEHIRKNEITGHFDIRSRAFYFYFDSLECWKDSMPWRETTIIPYGEHVYKAIAIPMHMDIELQDTSNIPPLKELIAKTLESMKWNQSQEGEKDKFTTITLEKFRHHRLAPQTGGHT